MKDTSRPLAAKQTLLLILVPMLATFVLLRLFLHLAGVRHAYPFGHLVHHLFWGVLLLIPAAFLLAFSTKTPSVAAAAGRKLAIATGDLLFSRAFAELARNGEAAQLRALSDASSALAEGERSVLGRFKRSSQHTVLAQRKILV